MTTLVIKNFPDDLHARLREQAKRHHRSVTREVLSLVEAGLAAPLRTEPVTAQEIAPADAPAATASLRGDAWQSYLSKLQRLPDGSFYNPDGIDDEAFFEELERFRAKSGFTPRDPFADA